MRVIHQVLVRFQIRSAVEYVGTGRVGTESR